MRLARDPVTRAGVAKECAGPSSLRARIERAVFSLARGLVAHPKNTKLCRALQRGALTGILFFKQLLRLVYRIVFLLRLEMSGALFEPEAPAALRARHARYHGLFRFVRLSGEGRLQSNQNIWKALWNAIRLCREGAPRLGVRALSALFEETEDVGFYAGYALDNDALASVFQALFWNTDVCPARYVDVASIRAEELGSAYESLLELHPAADPRLGLYVPDDAGAHERRGTGSYYTPPSVITEVLDRALEPKLEEAARSADPEQALLDLRVCDPACGAGFFLLSAALRIAKRLALARAKRPSAAVKAKAFSDVVARCIYGVDINPMAVELCRISLWFEAIRLGCSSPRAKLISRHVRMANALFGMARKSAPPSIQQNWKTLFLNGPFSWGALFPRVFSDRRWGFDGVLGNPPWIAHAGRAVQPMEPALHRFLCTSNPAFAGYRTTHGAFVYAASAMLREGGRLGLVLPTSIADLHGYAPVRRAHDALCQVIEPLADFGDGAFEGVFQPCMALVSVRAGAPKKARGASGRAKARPLGAPWALTRKDISAGGLSLLERLKAMEKLPASLFGERGFQTTPELREYLIELKRPKAPYSTPIREGADVTAFYLGKPRVFANRDGLGAKMRPAHEYEAVPLLVRQTARFPIAVKNDGHAFRNSLLACFEQKPWPWFVLLALLNSSLLRWFHYHAFRDARQGMPQVKIGHLRSIPAPQLISKHIRLKCKALCEEWSRRNRGIGVEEQRALDELVFDAYGLGDVERRLVWRWVRSAMK